MNRIKQITTTQFAIILSLVAILVVLFLVFITQQPKVEPSELYENTKNLNNYTSELKVYIGSNRSEDAFSKQEQKATIEDLQNQIYTFTENRTLTFGGVPQVISFEYMQTKDSKYVRAIEGGNDSIPLNEWIEIPSETYTEYNEENIGILTESFENKVFSNSIFDLSTLTDYEYKNNKYEFDVSENVDFQNHLEEIFSPIDCYEDAPTVLLVEVDGKNISKYQVKNDCLFIEYTISNIGNSRFDKLGE